jgi:hypothetical protein
MTWHVFSYYNTKGVTKGKRKRELKYDPAKNAPQPPPLHAFIEVGGEILFMPLGEICIHRNAIGAANRPSEWVCIYKCHQKL